MSFTKREEADKLAKRDRASAQAAGAATMSAPSPTRTRPAMRLIVIRLRYARPE